MSAKAANIYPQKKLIGQELVHIYLKAFLKTIAISGSLLRVKKMGRTSNLIGLNGIGLPQHRDPDLRPRPSRRRDK
jgi:hypothetical protein